jgi:hypothetical protein
MSRRCQSERVARPLRSTTAGIWNQGLSWYYLMTRRRPTGTASPSTPADDLKRLVRAARGVEPETLKTLAVMAEAFELEKEKAEIDADLSARKRLLSERRPQSLWDPQAETPKTLHAPAPPPVDVSIDRARLGQETPPSNPSEMPGLPENSHQRSRGRPPPVNAETPEVATKADHSEPSTAPDRRPWPSRSVAQPQGSEGDGPYQQRRVEWALKHLYPDGVLPPRLSVANITREIGNKLVSQVAREAAMSDGGTPSWNTVDRTLRRLKLR